MKEKVCKSDDDRTLLDFKRFQRLCTTHASIVAGYSEKYANTNANKLLQNTTIKGYIDEQLDKLYDEKTLYGT